MRPTSPITLRTAMPEMNKPVLIVMLTGWIDASGAASAAVEALKVSTSAEIVATFDPDTFIDFRARRPVMELREGLNTRINWAVPDLRLGKDDEGRDILILSGPEPDTAWNLFSEVVANFAAEHGVTHMFGLGAFPFAAPHTRPPHLSCTSPSPHVLAEVPFLKSTVDVPAGMEAILEHALTAKGISCLGLWSQVPHYVSALAYPAAAAALLGAVQMVAGLSIDISELRNEAQVQRERLDQLVAANADHLRMVQQLEEVFDEAVSSGEVDARGQTPATGDAIAAEVERFLREEMGRDNK